MSSAKPAGPVDLVFKQLVVSVPGGGGLADASLYWNAEARMTGAAVDAGVPWHDVHGAVGSVGQVDAGRAGPVVGNAWFDRATVAGMTLVDPG